MNSLWRALGMSGGATVPNFAFEIGDPFGITQSPTLVWSLRHGKRVEDGLAVTIFELNLTNCDTGTQELARNVLKKAKTIMLPGMLRCYDAVEHKDHVYVATEECEPLNTVLDEKKEDYYEDLDKFKEAVAFGLYNLCAGLSALSKNNLVHGNVCRDAVLVLPSGEWKLFGVELLGPHNEEHSLLQRYGTLLPEYRRPPEVISSNSSNAPVHATDAWGLGCLIFEVFATKKNQHQNPQLIKANEMRACKSLPRSIQPGFTSLTSTNPKMRMPIDKFKEDCELIHSSEYVSSLLQLEELSLKDGVERDKYYRYLSSVVDTFPLRACTHIILSKLQNAVQFGGGSATALEPLLKIGARLDDATFATKVSPIVVALFASQDHLVRCKLLSSASQYARLLPAQLVNEKIWPQFSSGFTNRNADMRELTVRALVHFAVKLDEKTMTNDVPKYIGGLQQDKEGPIRTNATICLGMIAQYIPEATRAKTLANGFGRMLRDPFIPSKIAAIKSISTTLEFFGPTQIAEQLLPAIAGCTIDAHDKVREVALSTVRAMVDVLQHHHDDLPVKEEDALPALTTPTAGSAPGQLPSSSSSSSNVAATSQQQQRTTAPAAAPPPQAQPAARQHQHVDPSPSTSSSSAHQQQPPPATTGASTSAAANANSWEDELDLDDSPPSKKTVPAAPSSVPSSSGVSKPASGMKLGGAKKKGFGAVAKKGE